jgi:hypothetical protein
MEDIEGATCCGESSIDSYDVIGSSKSLVSSIVMRSSIDFSRARVVATVMAITVKRIDGVESRESIIIRK